MKKRKFFFGAAVLIAISGLWYFGVFDGEEQRMFALIEDQPAMAELWTKANSTEEQIQKEPENVTLYIDAGLDWKSIAEQMEGEEEDRLAFFQKSLEAYERGIEKFGQKNILFYLNAGNVAQRMGDYAKAETYYKKAIAIAPADEMAYLALTDMYHFKLGKPKEDILPLFEAGIEIMVNPLPLISGRATYLRQIGEYAAALEDYRLLSKRFPENQGYTDIVAELEKALSAE
ncbi:MAG: hypothetical protein A3C90_00010 [Candidatus Magasanikbacteria bacterium RIFCSPHIGHO2_02_FULL_51_14]|uniref:Uncharacterized protein n=1 Tax=Candidatus Magasanikbacteria bacterium RIFCSPHIGHO2_02_FULL_51_14 TaxID=1798683 RepID=A0A1F6MCY7_9BACT|nr:MAG: hypothetical protein A3C90_00010 [Candidatus Magasanikbacteria bacterium RIFCSPHIGHO2_02_FULL_51_14]